MSEEEGPAKELNPNLAPTQSSSNSSVNPDLVPTIATSRSGLTAAPTASEPKFIGPYKLLRQLGEGGMGQVWLAEQTAPVQRQVALKLIRVGRYDEEILRRFRSERQSLAMMDHPAIAKVFDAGTTSDGQSYFVMEYVPGVPITKYCDDMRLSIRRRLKLFIRVCEGVQHAHQKAIIHRDLKPANILVAEVDGKPMPRIIDFGLAKAIGPPIIDPQNMDESMLTREGHWVGTPGFMSPEQADPSADVDTRTDVYSLGVVLYVLLTGDRPFDVSQGKKQPFYEEIRQLLEADPLKPSKKIRAQDAATQAKLAEERQNEPGMLVKQVGGDLDCIVLKALEKDRERRYATLLDLAADVDRYLQNVPVSAHPPGIAYRASKYARRHRVGVSFGVAALVLLIGFAVTQAIELRKIRQQRDRADRMTQFLTGIFKVPNPSEARGNTVTAREILDKASQQIGSNLNNDPELRAQLMETMSQTYTGLGLYGRAQTLTEQALAIQKSLFRKPNRETLASESYLGQLLRAQGRLPEAEKLLQQTIDAQRHVLGPNDPDTLASMDRLGYVYANEARHADAESLFRQTLNAERKVLGPDDPRTLSTLNELAEVLTPQGRYAEADQIYGALIAAQKRTLGPDHPAVLLSMSHAAENLEEESRLPEAEKLYSDVIAAQRRVLGPEHPQTLRAMTMLALTLAKEGRYSEADKLQSQVIEIKTRVLGPTHASTLQSMEMEALGLNREGNYADSEKMFRDVIETAEKTNQPATAAEAWYNFGCAEAARGRSDEAFADLNRAIENGLISPGELSADPELKSLHSDPRFEDLVAKARATNSASKK
jgi:non-specific serine/threonine protein kinase/serine/threonine-protein kinase